jgi:hypothetical protein
VQIFANVFAGSERSRVEMRLVAASSEEYAGWSAMEQVLEVDPNYREIYRREGAGPDGLPKWGLPQPLPSRHLWVGTLPTGLDPGRYWIEVRSTDGFGQLDQGRRALRVE